MENGEEKRREKKKSEATAAEGGLRADTCRRCRSRHTYTPRWWMCVRVEFGSHLK